MKHAMKVLITGAQFSNKGAQSLFFSLVEELRSRDSTIDIYYLPIDSYRTYDVDNFTFNIVCDNEIYKDQSIFSIKRYKRFLKCLYYFFAVSTKQTNYYLYSRILKEIDILIDISGFQLSDKFTIPVNRYYLRHIQDAKKNNKIVVLLPQSFGPFNYRNNKIQMDRLIEKTLKQVDLIFAREPEGKKELEELYNISGIIHSIDCVLQAKAVQANNIYKKKQPFKKNYELKGKEFVGIIPNKQTVVHGNEKEVLNKYFNIINSLLCINKNVCVFCHSNDLTLCRQIKALFTNDERVLLIEEEMNCLEFSAFVKQFKYIISSRYHAIIHAYKAGVPAIILGWAIKYHDLASGFEQSDFVFDLNEGNITDIITAIEKMDKNYRKESAKISYILDNLPNETCFDICWDVINKQLLLKNNEE